MNEKPLWSSEWLIPALSGPHLTTMAIAANRMKSRDELRKAAIELAENYKKQILRMAEIMKIGGGIYHNLEIGEKS